MQNILSAAVLQEPLIKCVHIYNRLYGKTQADSHKDKSTRTRTRGSLTATAGEAFSSEG